MQRCLVTFVPRALALIGVIAAALLIAPLPKAVAQFGGAGVAHYRLDADPGTSQVVVARQQGLLYTAQLLPLDKNGRLLGAVDSIAQIAAVFDQLQRTLAAAQLNLGAVVKLNVYVRDDEVAAAVRKELPRRFKTSGPAVAYVTTTLPLNAHFALDAVASYNQSLAPLDSPRIRLAELHAATNHTHFALSPSGSRVYVAGQAEKGNLREATTRTLESLGKTLEYLGLGWQDVVQIKSFVTPMANVADADDEVRRFFGDRSIPPLVWVEWKSDLPIEIELVASANRGRDPDSIRKPADLEFLTPPGMTTPTIYSRVVRTHGPSTIFVSGLFGEPGATGEQQVEAIFRKLEQALSSTSEESACDLRHLAKATYYVSDNDASTKLNELRPRFYDPRRPPAASKAMVSGVGLPKATITIDMIAVPRSSSEPTPP